MTVALVRALRRLFDVAVEPQSQPPLAHTHTHTTFRPPPSFFSALVSVSLPFLVSHRSDQIQTRASAPRDGNGKAGFWLNVCISGSAENFQQSDPWISDSLWALIFQMNMHRLLSGSATSWLWWRKKKKERKETKIHFVFVAVDVYIPPCADQWERFFSLSVVSYLSDLHLIIFFSLPRCFDFQPANHTGVHEVVSEVGASLMSSKWEQGSSSQRAAAPAALKPWRSAGSQHNSVTVCKYTHISLSILTRMDLWLFYIGQSFFSCPELHWNCYNCSLTKVIWFSCS